MKQAETVLTTDSAAKSLLMPRDPEGHKGTFGHGLLVAGCEGMAGAAVLGARAALRSGMGKLSVCSAEINRPILQVAVPEAVVTTQMPANLEEYDAIAIGPGLGQGKHCLTMMQEVLKAQPGRLVMDADALNYLAGLDNWPTLPPKGTIITPHLGEWRRLAAAIGLQDMEPAEAASECAVKHSLYIIIKGHRTTVCTPQGTLFINTTGNSGMATAGSGDVLTGIILSLLAQGYGPEQASRLGVWLHGKAGDIAAEQLTQWAMTASDITAHLPQAFKTLNTEH